MHHKPHAGRHGIKRMQKALGYSIQGFKACYRSEAAFREEVWAAVVLLPLALVLPVGWVNTALLMGSVLLVLLVELINSGLEAIVDRIGPEHHPLSGQAKDVGSAAVLVAIIIAIVVWLGVLLDTFIV